jgi:hypothetical protein
LDIQNHFDQSRRPPPKCTTPLYFLFIIICNHFLLCSAADVFITPVLPAQLPQVPACTFRKNTFITYTDGVCLPTGYWITSAPFAKMSCNINRSPAAITISLFSDAACTQQISTETLSSVIGPGSCGSRALGNSASVTCYPQFYQTDFATTITLGTSTYALEQISRLHAHAFALDIFRDGQVYAVAEGRVSM